jgi:hypothetical protein
VRRALPAAAALALGFAAVSVATATPGTPTLRLLARPTLTVAGTGFPAKAAVRVVAAAPHANIVRVVHASRSGAFMVELAGAKRSCLTGIVIVASAHGIRPVRLKQQPRACVPGAGPGISPGA